MLSRYDILGNLFLAVGGIVISFHVYSVSAFVQQELIVLCVIALTLASTILRSVKDYRNRCANPEITNPYKAEKALVVLLFLGGLAFVLSVAAALYEYCIGYGDVVRWLAIATVIVLVLYAIAGSAHAVTVFKRGGIAYEYEGKMSFREWLYKKPTDSQGK